MRPPSDLAPFEEAHAVEANLAAALPALRAAAEQADATGVIAPDTWRVLRGTGVLVAGLPTDEGGAGLLEPERARQLFLVLRRLGAADLSLARLVEGHLNAIALVLRYGTPAQRRDFAADIRDGALSGVWGADGSNPLRAEQDGAGIRLQGGKVLASGAGLLTRALATAATPDGPILVLLRLAPGERSDVSGWTAQGMRSTATGAIAAQGMRLDAANVIGAPGDVLRQPTFSGGAWRFCAAHLGAMDALIDLFREHLTARKRDGDPYQLQRIAQCVAAAGSAAFWIEGAADRLARGELPAADIVAFANLTRMVTERAALDVVEAVHRGVGLGGLLRPHPIERIARDLTTYLRQPVPDLAMSDAARAVLASGRPTACLWEAP